LTKSSPENGLIKKIEIYDDLHAIVNDVTNNWVFNERTCFYGLSYKFKERTGIRTGTCDFSWTSKYYVGFYPITNGRSTLSSVIETQYYNTGNKSSTTTYTYDSHEQVSKIERDDSQNVTHETLFTYPYDKSGVPYNEMTSQNFISSSVETESKIGGEIIEVVNTEFEKTITLGDFNVFNPSQINVSNGNGLFQAMVDFQLYSKDKLRQYKRSDGITVSLLWGYNDEYVVAEVVGAAYSEISSLVDMTLINNPPSDLSMRTELDKIRVGLDKALVTTFTQKPLVGITSQTSPNGLTNYYEYDAANRLMQVKDNDRNILRRMEYSYQIEAGTTNN
jgi:hypothetical protein